MCGFCGIAYRSSSPKTVDRSLLERMNRQLLHRGPDNQTYFVDEKVGFGHCRLSIIDLAGGAQPMSTSEGLYTLVFNGEIYNFQLLREDLIRQGVKFRTNSDTEVLLQLYVRYGVDCLPKLRGMFAFAIWDKNKKRLFMARDRLGKKPLVYSIANDSIIFGSELKALLEHPSVSRDVDRQAIDRFLTYQYIPSPQTIFQSIKKLPPAHFALWDDGGLTIKRYWDVPYQPKTTLSLSQATDQLLAKLRESVKLRMIADVPLGAFLSGGIDSSVVVGMMSEVSSQPVKTYCIGFEEADFSELEHARVVAKLFGCDHHEIVVKPPTPDLLPRLAWHYGEPFADPSALPSYIVARETRKHVTVALNGDGGDENFAGYYRYAAMDLLKRWDRVPTPLRQLISAFARKAPNAGRPSQLQQLLVLSDQTPNERYLQLVNVFTESQKQALYQSFMQKETATAGATAYLFDLLRRYSGEEGVDPYLATDIHSYLPECLMTKMDIASMAVSLETRSPLLDHEFVEMAARLPSEWKWKPIVQTKWILRQGLKGWLPDSILKRKKQGFGIPVDGWLRGGLKSYVESVVLSPQAESRGYFKPEVVRALVAEHASGKINHGYRLWSLMMLELWHQVYVDRTTTFP